jgi:hypothetical protein
MRFKGSEDSGSGFRVQRFKRSRKKRIDFIPSTIKPDDIVLVK